MTQTHTSTHEPPSAAAGAVDFGAEEALMTAYKDAGTAKALAMTNRGPIQFGADGRLDPAILEAYWRDGFYVFEGVIGDDERAEILADATALAERAPINPDSDVDAQGRPALGSDCQGRSVRMVRPLSDPLGGTDLNHGRHPVKMAEPDAPEGAPEWVMQLLLGSLQHSDACLRLYGHPGLLAVAAAVNGDDFTPFNEGLWIKQPRLGGSVAWHQDGWTWWDRPELDAGTHGFNFMVQLTGSDAANGLWVVPGSHARGKLDIAALRGPDGSDRLPDAVPLITEPGDAAIVNRQAVHGSFANTSDKPRISAHFGFHRRASVLDITSGGIHNPVSTYDDAYIRRRARMIMYAIDARRRRFPDEAPYAYQPLAAEADQYAWNAAARADIKDYNLGDLGI